MSTSREIGIVIKSVNYAEHHKIITILTASELISFIALGVRKIISKNRVALELGCLVEAEIFRARLKNKMSKLKKATLIKQPPLLEADTANVIMEMMVWFQKLTSSSPLILQAYTEGLGELGNKGYNHHFKVYVLTRLLDAYGIWPIWNWCVECYRKDRINGFEFYKGGFTCVNHTKKARSLDVLKVIKRLSLSFEMYKTSPPLINFELFQELIFILKNHI